MIVVACLGVIWLSVPLLGGRLSRLGTIRFQKSWLIPLAMAVQIPLTTIATDWFPIWVAALIHIGTYGLALAFVWFNRTYVGMAVLVTGAICNLLAIMANGGIMPATASALETAGIENTGEFQNSGLVEDARLWFLGDVFAIPDGWPLANVFSVGDLLLVLGGGYLVHQVSGSRLFPKNRRLVIEREVLSGLDAEQIELAVSAAATPQVTQETGLGSR